MGNLFSVANEQLHPILEKVSNLNIKDNVNKKDVIAAIFALYGMYIGGAFIAKCYKMQQIRKQLEGVPNKPRVLTGNLYDFPGVGPAYFDWVQGKVNQFKKFYQFWLGPFFPCISLCHPDTVKIILKSSAPKYTTHEGSVYVLLLDWLGDGLLLSSGSKWFRNRRLLTPAFHFEILKPYLEVYHVATDKFLNKMATLGNDGKKSVPIYAFVSLLTLDIILRCAFSYDGDIQAQGKNDPYVASVMKTTDTLMQRLFNPLLHNPIMFYLSSTGRENRKAVNHLHQVSKDVILRRKKTLAENPNEPQKRYLDFLDILLAARDEEGKGLTDREIRDEVDTFLFEGHDTTASGISWTLYNLACHPEYQERARQEVIDVLGSRSSHIEWGDLSRLPYMTQCIKESMRVHPPVPFIGRQLSEDVVIDGCTIPKYTNVEVSIFGVHHNPEVWGEDHLEYKPDRFHPDNMQNKDAYDYIPFSAGARNCIGQSFALNEEKVVIAKVLQRFELRVDPNHKVEKHPETVTRPTNDIKVFFKPLH